MDVGLNPERRGSIGKLLRVVIVTVDDFSGEPAMQMIAVGGKEPTGLCRTIGRAVTTGTLAEEACALRLISDRLSWAVAAGHTANVHSSPH